MDAYEARVRELEDEGLDRSDAQGVADVEFRQAGRCGYCHKPGAAGAAGLCAECNDLHDRAEERRQRREWRNDSGV